MASKKGVKPPKPKKRTEMARQIALRDKPKKTSKHLRLLPAVDTRYTVDEIADALRRNYGTLTYTCLDLDCSQQQLIYAINKHPELKIAREEARTSMVDLAEKKLTEVIQGGNVNAIIFALKTIGAKRGWQETQQWVVGAMTEAEQKQRVQQIFGLPDDAPALSQGQTVPQITQGQTLQIEDANAIVDVEQLQPV